MFLFSIWFFATQMFFHFIFLSLFQPLCTDFFLSLYPFSIYLLKYRSYVLVSLLHSPISISFYIYFVLFSLLSLSLLLKRLVHLAPKVSYIDFSDSSRTHTHSSMPLNSLSLSLTHTHTHTHTHTLSLSLFHSLVLLHTSLYNSLKGALKTLNDFDILFC